MTDTSSKSEQYRIGTEIRRKVLGDEYVDNSVRPGDDFTEPFQDLITEVVWGRVWNREGLAFHDRSLINIALLAALNRPTELKLHVRGALRNGCTPEEIRETFMQVAVYVGVPASLEAFRIAREVLREDGYLPDDAPNTE